MQDLLNTFKSVFDFFSATKIAGMSLTTWIVITLVFVAISFFVRGNKS
jgi:hypothetical protein